MTPTQAGAGRQRRSRLASPRAIATTRADPTATATKTIEWASQVGASMAQAAPGARPEMAAARMVAAAVTGAEMAKAAMTRLSHRPHYALFAFVAPFLLWPSIASAQCEVPSASSSEEELLTFLECSIEDAARASAARNAMAARLRDLYLEVDGEA